MNRRTPNLKSTASRVDCASRLVIFVAPQLPTLNPMSSKKDLRRLALEREQQRRYEQAIQACPLARAEFERLVDHVSDQIVEHGHSQDLSQTTAWLTSQGHPVEAVTAFLAS